MRQLQPDTLIKNPQGKPLVSSVEIACSAANLWRVVGCFEGFDAFIPTLACITMTGTGVGSLRKKRFHDGNIVVEQLNSHDALAMRMSWTTIYNTLGVARLWAAMSVESLGENLARATWTIIAEPVETGDKKGFEQFIQDFADSALDNVRRLLG
ncbi:Polyketide cyclase / dehydrase and lipid transport [Pseudomonas fluorescens]|uniref:Polyketide cyclase / dehydrase and lipid transport n=1 Tax=Pseudomonas fluorescens TaxID=294 RepID=A0A379I589_PSEFL|nr:SRPBCC family protein [Pseudomonas fluorescens]AIG04060.1 polyketide cyclase [Pseudomonas fluorescens]SUD27209.1 Polyketide cyclase / dehydrase and lipid transport [Pseudomonas fluorescens]